MADQAGEAAAAVPAGHQGPADGEAAGPQAPRPGPGRGGEQRRPARGRHPGRGRGGRMQGAPGTARVAEVGMHGTGFVKVVKDFFGFISSPELDDQIFFHGSEVLQPEGHEGPDLPFAELIAVGDEVEFVVGQNTGKRSNAVAKQVRRLPVHGVRAQPLGGERFGGTVSRELNSGSSWRNEDSNTGLITYAEAGGQEATIEFVAAVTRHLRGALRKGMAVEFSVCTDNATRQRRAVHIEVRAAPRQQQQQEAPASGGGQQTVLHGFILAMKPQSGVIRCVERAERLPFKRSDAAPQHQERLQPGAEVLVSLQSDARGGEAVVGVAPLPPGTLQAEHVSAAPVQGRVVKPFTPGEAQEEGLIAAVLDTEHDGLIAFWPGPLDGSRDDAGSLWLDDEVECTVVTDLRTDTATARDLRLLSRAADRRELGQIRTLKNNFGFIRCCCRAGDLFFHYSELRGVAREELRKDDEVEFSVLRHPEHGTVGARVKRVPPGTAVFETVSEAELVGVVRQPLTSHGPGVTSSGVLAFEEEGQPAKILFGEGDMKERVYPGDHVSFRIATSPAQQQRSQRLGPAVSRLASRRATKGALLRLAGTVRQVKPSYGFIRAPAGPAGGERSLFYHASEVKGLGGEEGLRIGDAVAFTQWLNPKTRELNARRVTRTKEAEAPPPSPAADAPPAGSSTPGERPAQAAKYSGGGGALPPPQVRLAAMPDGTRGFHMGRGGALRPPAGAAAAEGQGAPGSAAGGEGEGPTLSKSGSGSGLNPSAATFLPQALSSCQLADADEDTDGEQPAAAGEAAAEGPAQAAAEGPMQEQPPAQEA